MSTVLEVEHITHYRYARPVRFGERRLMFRPRASRCGLTLRGARR